MKKIIYLILFVIIICTAFILISTFFQWNNMNNKENLSLIKNSFYINIFCSSFFISYFFLDKFRWSLIPIFLISLLILWYINYLMNLPNQYIIVILPILLIINLVIFPFLIWKSYTSWFKRT
jgi:hypothetical protein